jgi:hypothetical protein
VRSRPDFSTAPRKRRSRTLERLAVVAGLLVLGASAGSAWKARVEARQAHARLAAVDRDIVSATARRNALVPRSGAGAERVARVAASRSAPPATVVAAVAAVLPADARIERLAIDYGRTVTLEMLVVAREAAAWDRFLDRLERSPRFREVEPGPESRDGEVRSVVRARWSGDVP